MKPRKYVFLLLCCGISLPLKAEISDSAFNAAMTFAAKWLVITSASPAPTPPSCRSGTVVLTTFFTGLKPGLMVCIQQADFEKLYAEKKLKETQQTVKDAYLRFSGTVTDGAKVSAASPSQRALFSFEPHAGTLLRGTMDSLPPDQYAREKGFEATYAYRILSSKATIMVDTFALDCNDREVVMRKFTLDKSHTMIDVSHSTSDETIDHLTVWRNDGRIAWRETLNSTGEGGESYSTSTIRMTRGKCEIITETSSGGDKTGKTITRGWNGSRFE